MLLLMIIGSSCGQRILNRKKTVYGIPKSRPASKKKDRTREWRRLHTTLYLWIFFYFFFRSVFEFSIIIVSTVGVNSHDSPRLWTWQYFLLSSLFHYYQHNLHGDHHYYFYYYGGHHYPDSCIWNFNYILLRRNN